MSSVFIHVIANIIDIQRNTVTTNDLLTSKLEDSGIYADVDNDADHQRQENEYAYTD